MLKEFIEHIQKTTQPLITTVNGSTFCVTSDGMKMLELRNRPEQSLTLSALAIPGLRAGQVIFADLPGIDVRRTFLVEEVTQDIVEETMSLKVKVV